MRITTVGIFVALLAACGTDVAGPSSSLFSCALGEASDLSRGGVLQVRGSQNGSLCLAGAEGGAEFVYIPFFGEAPPEDEDRSVRLSVELTGAGLRAPTGPPNPWIGGADEVAALLLSGDRSGGLGSANAAGRVRTPDVEFHDWLLRRQREELNPRIRSARADPTASAAPDFAPRALPSVGDTLDFNVAISCTTEDIRRGTVQYISDRSVVVSDIENPGGGLGPADYAFFGETVDTLVYPVDTAHFGEPTDVDDNGHVIIFFTRAVNERTPPGSTTFTGGFFWSGDLFPEQGTSRLQACPASNHGEMFYMLAADPAGVVNNNRFETQFVRDIGVGIIAHEFQHLINAGRRLWVNDATTLETTWLDEGLSHIAEELIFYAAAGLEPGLNLTVDDIRAAPNGVNAFNRYMAGDIGNFRRFLARPDTASLMGIDRLPTRGATWAFLRYAADRSDRDDAAFFFDVVNSRVDGLDNLNGVLGEPALAWMQDWTVAVYADDAVAGVDARFTQPSWNFRALYGDADLGGRFPLQVLVLDAGESETIELRPGGTAYPRFGVEGGGRAAIHVEADQGLPGPRLRGSVLRTR